MPSETLDRFRLDDQVAIVTGGGKGIGEAIAVAFAEAGADCVLVARTKSDLESVARAVRERGRRALPIAADVNDLGSLAEIVERTIGELGRLDVVVNNAGGSRSKPILRTRVEELEKSFHFNVSVPFELVRLSAPHMLEAGAGSVVNISSVAAKNAVRGNLAHGLTKAALNQLTRLMAAELAPKIRVNAVLPGAVETDALRGWLASMDPAVRDTMRANTPLRRNGEPRDIADAVLYLCSPAAAWVTGELLKVDGMAADDLIPHQVPDL
ncbi:MAG TPA: glucose 1-dehydrogenase [Myxococcota bacterium]|nr:glucose 1-dehydrogenase [Myxococcota bacterium]